MNENYDLESILEEIRQKKQAEAEAKAKEAEAAAETSEQNAEDSSDEAAQEETDTEASEAESSEAESEEADKAESIDEEIEAEADEAEDVEEAIEAEADEAFEKEDEAHIAEDEAEESGEGFVFNSDNDESEELVDEEDDGEAESFSKEIDFDIDAAIKNMTASTCMNEDGTLGKMPSKMPGKMPDEKSEEPAEEEHEEKAQENVKEEKKNDAEEDLNEYRKPEDAPAILEELHQLKSSLTLRLVLTVIIFAAVLYLAAATILPLPLPAAISLWEAPVMFIGANVVLTAAAILINNSAIGGGLISLLKFKANNDSLVAFAALAAIVHGAAMTASPEWLNTTAVNIYFPMAVLGIMFNLVGKMMFADRTSANFKIVSASYQKYAVHKVEDEQSDLFAEQTAAGKRDIAYFSGTDFLTDFLKTAYDETYIERHVRILAPTVVFASFIIGAVGFFITRDIFAGISAFAATACIAAPLTSTLIGNIPMGRAARKLYQRSTCITGYEAVTELGATDTILLDDDDIFPQGTIQMHGMKPFNDELIEDAVADAASIAEAVSCPLKFTFIPVMNKYSGGRIRNVAEYELFDGEGIIADIEGREVVMGNRSMMNKCNIFLPSKEQEEKLSRDGREVMYISSDGHLSAVFVLSYHADSDVAETLLSVQQRGIKITVHSTDPFIGVERIADLFSLNSENISVMSPEASEKYEQMSAQQSESKCLMASTASPMMLVKAILSADRIRASIAVGNILQTVSMLMGVAIVAFFTVTGSVIYLGCVPVLSYQIAWSVVTAIVNAMRKY